MTKLNVFYQERPARGKNEGTYRYLCAFIGRKKVQVGVSYSVTKHGLEMSAKKVQAWAKKQGIVVDDWISVLLIADIRCTKKSLSQGKP